MFGRPTQPSPAPMLQATDAESDLSDLDLGGDADMAAA